MFEAATRKKGYTFNEGRVKHMKLPKTDAIEGVNAIIDPAWITGDNMVGHFALGCQAFRDYKLDVAEAEFKKVIALEPNSPLAYHYLGRTLFEQNRLQEAELIFKMAIKKYLDYEAWEVYSNKVLKDAVEKNFLDAGIYEFFTTSYYGQQEDILLLARLYEQWGHYDEAETFYQHFLQTDLLNIEGYVNLANFYEHTGRFNESENILKDFYVKYDKGLPQLLKFYKHVTGLYPDNGEWFLKAGLFQYALAQKNPDEYENDIKTIDPFTGEIIYARRQAAEYRMPDPILPRIIRYGTVIPVAKNKLLLKPFTDGIYYFKKALEAIPSFEEKQFADIQVKIGNLYTWQGLPDSAVTFFEAALELNPDDAGTRNKLAVTYSKAYRFTEALVQLDSLLKKGQLNLDKELMLARYKLQDGDIKGAGELIFNAEIIDPSGNLQITLLKAALAKETKNFKEAIAIYTGIVEMNPKDSTQLYNIARLYALGGNRKEAWKWLELSLNAGFNYKMVLLNDPAFNSLRKDTGWLARFNKWPGKVYFNPDFTKWNYMFSNLEIYSPLLVQ